MAKQTEGHPARLVGYVRVSTAEQADEGVSLRSQRDKIAGFADLHNYELVATIEDAGASAKSIEGRKGLDRALKMLDSGEADGLVIYKLDRLTRSMRDWQTLIDGYFGAKAGKQLASVSDHIDTRTAAGLLVLNILMTVAEWERQTIVERTRVGMAYKQRLGERVSRTAPYGKALADDGKRSKNGHAMTLIDDEGERMVLGMVGNLRLAGWSLRRIAAHLDAAGVATRSGRPWRASTLSDLLKSGRIPVPSTINPPSEPDPEPASNPGD